MFKKVIINNNYSCKKSVDYSEQKLYHERLKKARAVNLRGNRIFVDMKNGYGKMIPKNKNIKF